MSNHGKLYLHHQQVKMYSNIFTDITGPPCTVFTALTQNDNSQVAVDLYLAEFTKTMPGRYLQPGWIGSVNVSHNKTITYGDVKKLIYNSTELEVGIFQECDVNASIYLFCRWWDISYLVISIFIKMTGLK